ncbi:glycosyltransferase family 2 protein [Candidatus Dependentiae bacterium]|nr:glycosyltransferase family 2 protein [Candidatus Dependentiae bacterium]
MNEILTIGIVSFNGAKYMKMCLDSVLMQTFTDYKIFFIDNGSTDNTSEVIKPYLDKLEFIKTGKNLGFGRGHNIGIKKAFENSSKYYCALNIDTILDAELFKVSIKFLESNELYGAVSPKIFRLVNGKKTEHIDVIGGFLKRRIAYINSNNIIRSHDVFLVGGTVPVYRLDALNEVGDFDPDYFLYFEDIDLAWRLQQQGWKIRYLPGAKLWHVKGVFTENKDTFFAKSPYLKGELIKNRYYTMLKNLSFSYFVKLSPWIIAAEIGIFLYFSFISPTGFKFYVKAIFEILKNFNHILKKRRKILETSKLNGESFKYIFKGI